MRNLHTNFLLRFLCQLIKAQSTRSSQFIGTEWASTTPWVWNASSTLDRPTFRTYPGKRSLEDAPVPPASSGEQPTDEKTEWGRALASPRLQGATWISATPRPIYVLPDLTVGLLPGFASFLDVLHHPVIRCGVRDIRLLLSTRSRSPWRSSLRPRTSRSTLCAQASLRRLSTTSRARALLSRARASPCASRPGLRRPDGHVLERGRLASVVK